MPRRLRLYVARPTREPRLRSKLEETRVRAGPSQTIVAQRAGVRRETVARIEARCKDGRLMGCRPQTAQSIARALEAEMVSDIFEPMLDDLSP